MRSKKDLSGLQMSIFQGAVLDDLAAQERERVKQDKTGFYYQSSFDLTEEDIKDPAWIKHEEEAR